MTGVKIGASKDILVNVIPSLTKNLPISYQHPVYPVRLHYNANYVGFVALMIYNANIMSQANPIIRHNL